MLIALLMIIIVAYFIWELKYNKPKPTPTLKEWCEQNEFPEFNNN